MDIQGEVFNPMALRAEDTLLLADLIEAGELPLFVAEATVQHAIPLSLMECFRKDVRAAYLEGCAYDIIASRGIRIRANHRERLRMLLSMWKTSGQNSTGRWAWIVLVIRQSLQRIGSLAYRCLRFCLIRANRQSLPGKQQPMTLKGQTTKAN